MSARRPALLRALPSATSLALALAAAAFASPANAQFSSSTPSSGTSGAGAAGIAPGMSGGARPTNIPPSSQPLALPRQPDSTQSRVTPPASLGRTPGASSSVVAPAPGSGTANGRQCEEVRANPSAYSNDMVEACAVRRGVSEEKLDRLERSNKRAVGSICSNCLD